MAYKPILAKYEAQDPGAVKMVLKDYPLNSTCNPNSSMLHAGRVRRGRGRPPGAGAQPRRSDGRVALHAPAGDDAGTVRQAARDIGQVTDFDAKYAATLELVKGDVALGTQLDISSTPTFFINGVKVEGSWAPQYFDQAIAYELQHAPAQ